MNKWQRISDKWGCLSDRWYNCRYLKIKDFLAFRLTYFNKPKISETPTIANFVTLVLNKNTYGSRY
jgi:hypothetical protein